MEKQKPPLEMRRDSGISCFTPSPPPKKPSLPSLSGGTHSERRELRRRPSSRDMQRAKSKDDSVTVSEPPVELPPKLDLRSLIGSDSDSDVLSSGAVSTDRTWRSDEHSDNPELAVPVETPSSDGNSRMSMKISTPDGYQSDIDCSSSSPAASSGPSLAVLGFGNLRRYGSGGLEEESEGSVLKVKLKIKTSDEDNRQGEKGKAILSGKGSPQQSDMAGSVGTQKGPQPSIDSGSALSKYAPLPGIGHRSSNQLETVYHRGRSGQGHTESVAEQHMNKHHVEQDIREQRLRVLERSASHTEISMKKGVPVPPPQSAKTVSRREMRMQQFARRKSASQAEALSRQTRTTPAGSQPSESESARSVLLAVRLPTGKRVQNLFKSSDSLRTVAIFAMQSEDCSSLDVNRVCLVTNDMPKRVWTDLALTIDAADIKDRTLLHLEETD